MRFNTRTQYFVVRVVPTFFSPVSLKFSMTEPRAAQHLIRCADTTNTQSVCTFRANHTKYFSCISF